MMHGYFPVRERDYGFGMSFLNAPFTASFIFGSMWSTLPHDHVIDPAIFFGGVFALGSMSASVIGVPMSVNSASPFEPFSELWVFIVESVLSITASGTGLSPCVIMSVTGPMTPLVIADFTCPTSDLSVGEYEPSFA